MTTMLIVLLALLATVAAIVLVWRRRGSAPPREAEWQEVLAAAHQGGYELILSTELAAI